MSRWQFAALAFVTAGTLVARAGYPGSLEIGKPTVEGERYTIPVVLSGGDDRVAALDFRLRYGPAVFQPGSAATGTAAHQSNKIVTANMATPGEYIVVMMGPNQNTLDRGEVARIVMQRVGEPRSGSSDLTIADPTLATWEGIELPAQGMTWSLDFDTPDEENERSSEGEIAGSDSPAGDERQRSDGGADEAHIVTAVVRELFKKGDTAASAPEQLQVGGEGDGATRQAETQQRPAPIQGPIVPQAPREQTATPVGGQQLNTRDERPGEGGEHMAMARPQGAGKTFESEINQVASAPLTGAAEDNVPPASGVPWRPAGLVAAVAVTLAAAVWWRRRKHTG